MPHFKDTLLRLTHKIKYSIFYLLSTLTIASCSTVKLSSRAGKDIYISPDNMGILKGNFSNIPNDSLRHHQTLIRNFRDDLSEKQEQLSMEILSVAVNSLTLKLKKNNVVIDSLIVKGKLRNGYFRVNRQFKISGILGPLVWVLSEGFEYIGVTNENNLTVISSGGSGAMYLLVLPIYVTGGDPSNIEYLRTK